MRRIRTLAILCGIHSAAFAQIQDLATTANGEQTYFATSYRQKDSAQAGYLKIFRIAENGLELVKQLNLYFSFAGADPNFFLAEHPSVSADGRVLGFTAARTCAGGSHCIAFVYNSGFLVGSTDRSLGPGVLTVSPDGHSYLLFNNTDFVVNSLTVGDIQSGSSVALAGYRLMGNGQQALANNGIALLLSLSNTPGLWKAGKFTPLSFRATPTNACLSADGNTIVYETSLASSNFELHSYSVASGRDVLLAKDGIVSSDQSVYQPASYFHPSLTFDGKSVSYVLNGRLLVQSTDGTEPISLTSAVDGVIVNSVITGAGNAAFAATSTGRLLRISVATGALTELVAAVPHLEVTGGAQVPGGRLDVMFTGSTGGSNPALVGAGGDAPVISRANNTLTLQIPWEAAAPSTVKLIVPGNPSPFEEAHDLALQVGLPVFYTLPSKDLYSVAYALAAHEDFSGIVSESNPARPGEIIHMYFTGLGAVSPTISTGAVTPLSPLFQLLTPFTCHFNLRTKLLEADIRFAGLAPGTIGVEQIDILVPAEAAPPTIGVACVSQPLAEAFTGYSVLPIAP